MADNQILDVAICQFPVGMDTRENGERILAQIREAAGAGAAVAHFPELALTGYPGSRAYTWKGFDWDEIDRQTAAIRATAREYAIWVLLPAAHRVSGKALPCNCVSVIDPRGTIVERYDKRFCTREDLSWFTPGRRQTVFSIAGVRCGIIICYEKWFPELFRSYKKAGVQLIFDSIHSQERDFTLRQDKECLPDAERALWIAHARINHLWISVSNHCRPEQDNTSFIVDPDGQLEKLPFKRTCVSVHRVDTGRTFWDPSEPFRDIAIAGGECSGPAHPGNRGEGT
jgi:predicted amidohydrolase